MNRFFTKSRKDATEDLGNSSASFGTKKPKKGKKGQVEQKPELDLAAALPSSDDFRTSLIMPNLSARFSMLREQDDPKSKLGKASDDSVLSSNRQSRLYDFGFKSSTLADIDEMSINGSIKPPFLMERQTSMETLRTTSDDMDGGSVMSRARPGEGNILFGGRQKVYKISGTGNNRGRALYEDDVSMSSFQRLRKEEKERREQELRDQVNTASLRDDTLAALSGYDKRRETSSSTNSGPSNSRSSTAATSIASQGATAVSPTSQSQAPLERSVTKTRRLYEQGLDQHMHEQQTSQLNRLNTVQRQQHGGTASGKSSPTALSQARSASNLSDRYQRSNPASRTVSPPPVTYNNHAIAPRDNFSNASSPVLGHSSTPPISPVQADQDELTSALNPNDRGKATALGAFNKPKAFSEEQYLQRQMHLHQGGRDTPPPRRGDDGDDGEGDSSRRESDQAQTAPKAAAAPTAFSVFQNAANQMRVNGAQSSQPQTLASGQQRSFSASADGADVDSDASRSPLAPKLVAPPIHEHPALRSQQQQSDHVPARKRIEDTRPIPQSAAPALDLDGAKGIDLDSPTLGPNGGCLSGLVRQHLRNVSNVSSNYSDHNSDTTGPQDNFYQQSYSSQNLAPSVSDTAAHSAHSHSNPWDLEDFDRSDYMENDSMSSVSPVDQQAPQSTSTTTTGRKLTLDEMEARAFEIQQEAEARRAAWELEMMTKHKRQPSVEERDAFQQELAQRQKAIAERMRQVEEDSHSVSNARKAFGMLRSKSSKDSMASSLRHEPSRMKMPGYSGSSTSVNKIGRDQWRSEDERHASLRSRGSSHSRPRYGGNTYDNQYHFDAGRESSRDTTPDATFAVPSSNRSRSNSKSTATSQYSEHSLHPSHLNTSHQVPSMPSPAIGLSGAFPPSPRPSPGPTNGPMSLQRPIQTGYAVSATPPLSAVNTPTGTAFGPNRQQPRRRTVNKQDISEPTLLSSTSVQETVALPPGASLKNGQDFVPPLPPMNPRRRFGFGRSSPNSPAQTPTSSSPTAEIDGPFLQARTYSGDDAEKLRRQRQKLRKTSSEGHGLREISQYQARAPPSQSPPRTRRY
ncbi:hypothetical protein EJ05DRAFT_261450 [Pseudovirgaria hyperparasitica]|uniref:Uncharacterized protein n=1 Tax=Pseudovirgaria hyperparasitica TaxID=470096 RepID=A0A6A6WH21_9PEZI|nr:uncharacterized protein EJ05DRAFT_261450 [Pseudovirgaria hyperparasitica]KAF2761360.1 hypothetical protein EJ05DRAFT_261450 [Pseudovirgaria hyperparasitica]